jgi:hypothetical protein
MGIWSSHDEGAARSVIAGKLGSAGFVDPARAASLGASAPGDNRTPV